jgi:TonB family protein
LIHFDFDDRYQDELVVGSAISRREGVLLSAVVHAAMVLVILFGPGLSMFELSPEQIEARREEQLRRQQEQQRDEERFVFVEPRVDFEARRPPPRAELSDIDRQAQARERAETPQNPLPFSRGDTVERTEAAEPERARGAETTVPPNTEPPQPEPAEKIAPTLPPADAGLRREPETSRPAPGLLGDALKNLERYVENQTFDNPQGGTSEPGATIQFDTKGVEFGPWLRRFVQKVRRNWFIPQAAMTFRGRVVITFNIHKDGHITDVEVVGPSSVEAFNRAAYYAILGSNPVDPLPPEYPEPVAFFTVTFLYNEPL